MTQVDERPGAFDRVVTNVTDEADAQAIDHVLRIMDHTGDLTLTWNPRNAGEVASARQAFRDRKADGYLAYMLLESGAKGEVIRDFNPEARSIVMTPQMAGG